MSAEFTPKELMLLKKIEAIDDSKILKNIKWRLLRIFVVVCGIFIGLFYYNKVDDNTIWTVVLFLFLFNVSLYVIFSKIILTYICIIKKLQQKA